MHNIWVTGITVIFFAILAYALITVIFQWLWNTTMPDIFSFKKITFWQSLRLLLIASILFGSIPKINKNLTLSLSPHIGTIV